jgi:transcription initiation factor TFIIIB Brf1 subunit/transcription initiation factor TFIIB
MPPKRIPKARSYPRTRHESSDEDDEELNELFRQAYEAKTVVKEENSKDDNLKLISENSDKNCSHKETVQEQNMILCNKCGLQLGSVDDEIEVKLDGYQFKKCQDKSIAKDLEEYNLHPDVIRLADKYYNSVTNGVIKRGKLRIGIMFACVFQAYKDLGKPQTADKLQKLFGITRKNVSKGLTYFCLGQPERSTVEYITARHFIPQVFEKLNIRMDIINGCYELFDQIENKSSLLNRSNPQSVSKAVVFYYLRKMNNNMDLTSYSEKVQLSETTINRICNTIDTILTPETTK